MEEKLKNLLKALKINETTISTVMGAVVVLIVGILMFNYFKSINPDEGLITETAKVIEVTEGEKPEYLPDTYKVEKGDHLWGIAEKFYKSGYNFTDIAEANSIVDPNSIEVGQELIIPQVAVKKITVESDSALVNTIESDTYTTVAGDYLWDIAVRAYGDGFAWTNIYQANKALIGSNPGLLYKGVTLSLPR
ncbi:LysM peptidoglycan-binding domain-containing protein [Patescibacteria group bacterium]|nr:LysM peptidoglycan-binding domain-containing protein [Patescibacteria group bacterium]MBU1256338.1 LysM peptidoglycan-binding domain-containing protein [Patescibacteria group bacterium]MBU1457366.1 LysM peptidoglycan-binding domain-containing protein [Patescibacteria group bacterium]